MTAVLESLWQSMQTGSFEGTLAPLDVDAGQLAQLEMLRRWQASGKTTGGYKIGLTSGQARDSMGPGVRPFGYILEDRIFPSGCRIARAGIGKMGVENELVFRIGTSIKAGDATAAIARSVVDGVAPGFEINQARLSGKPSHGMRVADNLSQWGIVAGEFIDPDRDFNQLTVALSVGGELLQTIGAAGHIDDHFKSLAALINGLARYDRGLTAGMKVITGSFTRQPVLVAGTYTGDFGSIGTVVLEVI